MVRSRACSVLYILFALGCDVPAPLDSTGGVDLPEGPCGRGVVVINTDYQSTSVSLVSLQGEMASPVLLSSQASGATSMTLSGDVHVPLERPASGKIVLIDAYPNAVLTWIEPRTAEVLGQMSVGTGFASNPHDYIEVDEPRAYVSRYGSNPTPGKQPHDNGGDLLIVDTRLRTILGSISLASSAEGWLPRPDRMLHVGPHVAVVLQRFSSGFDAVADGRLVGVDPSNDSVAWVVEVKGLSNCGGLALSPDGTRLALSCTGGFHEGDAQLGQSGVVLYDVTTLPPVELQRYATAAALGAAVTPELDFASDRMLVGTAYGSVDAVKGDRLYALALKGGEVHALGEAPAFELGGVRCSAACAGPCLVADANRLVLRKLAVDGRGEVVEIDSADVRTAVGLPPRSLGRF